MQVSRTKLVVTELSLWSMNTASAGRTAVKIQVLLTMMKTHSDQVGYVFKLNATGKNSRVISAVSEAAEAGLSGAS